MGRKKKKAAPTTPPPSLDDEMKTETTPSSPSQQQTTKPTTSRLTAKRNRRRKLKKKRENLKYAKMKHNNKDDNNLSSSSDRILSGNGDCFDDVIWNKGIICGDDGSAVRESWLNKVEWIGREQREVEGLERCDEEIMQRMEEEEEEESDPRRRVKSRRVEFPEREMQQDPTTEDDDSNNHHSTTTPSTNEISSLQIQLNQIKRRLWPAAINCINNNDNASSSKKTALKTPRDAFEEARRIYNPFEELGEGRRGGLNKIFVNRSAVKLANLDALLGFIIAPKKSNKTAPSLFRFVDLCGAPGGFSEYLLYRCHSNGVIAKGWGMSLIGSNEDGAGTPWKLEHMAKFDGGANVHYQVCDGNDGTGDIHNWDNVEALREQIYVDSAEYSNNNWNGVDLVVADGGFDAQRDSEHQEQVTNKFIICQVAAALSILRIGGMLVFKSFGARSYIGKMLMRHLFPCFEKMIIVKPVLSRPASAERYVVCYHYQGPSSPAWEAKTWRDEMLNNCDDETMMVSRSLESGEGNEEDVVNLAVFDEYLDRTDQDILRLNIKACFGILSYLERKSQNGCDGSGKNANKDAGKDAGGNLPRKRSVDIFRYKKAWRIDR